MNPEIPGYYFDPEKRRYFKIENSNAAPANAAYSSDAVKRRQVQERKVRATKRRTHELRNHTRRPPVSRDGIYSSILARELGLPRAAECGRGRAEDSHVRALAWARGALNKGSVKFAPRTVTGHSSHVPCLYVHGDDATTGLGMAYTTLNQQTLVASYIPTNEVGKITHSREYPMNFGTTLRFGHGNIESAHVSSIKYHAGTNKILVTSQERQGCGLTFFSPPRLHHEDPVRYGWMIGETDHCQRLIVRRAQHRNWVIHSSTPAPASSDMICVVGTNKGILKVQTNGSMYLMGANNPQNKLDLPQEMFAQDFQVGNPNVVLAGGRQARLWMSDFRAEETQWSFTPHASSISHIRCVNPHQVLVAGLENSMSLYDVRYLRRDNGGRPLLSFLDHVNEANFHIGWDVDVSLGIVAAAQGNGSVRLFSLRSGRRMRCPSLDPLRSSSPIKALMFQTMPRERLPSLFVGEGAGFQKFSFDAAHVDDEC